MQRPSVELLSDSQAGVSRAIASRLRAAGHEAWLVGGCVRDLALGRRPGDVDIATDAVPKQVESLFERTFGVGRAFGTVVVADFGDGVEVTTFRADGAYSDGRRPDDVRFSTTLEEDAARRDFTCNALFLDPLNDRLADPTGGLADLQSGLLRAIGDPRRRFTEDSLRVLRLVRFAATHDLRGERGTVDAARATGPLLARVARERVLAELTKTFERGNLSVALRLVDELGVAPASLGTDAVDPRAVRVAAGLALGPGAVSGFAVALANAQVGEASRVAALARLANLRPARELLRAVDLLLRALGVLADGGDDAALVRARSGVDLSRWRELVGAFVAADTVFDPSHLARLDTLLQRWPAERELPAPLLDAQALQERGVERGPRLGQLLHALIDAQITEQVRSRDDAEAFVSAHLS